MTPQPWFSGVVLFIGISALSVQAQYDLIPGFGDDSMMNDDLSPIADNQFAMSLSDRDLVDILTRLNQAKEKPRLEFPKLSKNQRKFAVNPAYPADVSPDFPDDTDETQVEKKDTTPVDAEVAKDPFAEESKDKKASLGALLRGEPAVPQSVLEQERINDIYFTTIVAVSSALAAFAVVGAGICYHRYQKKAKAAEDVEYPAYGVTGNGRDISPTSADRKLAQNAQLYHYQHQKQQMLAFDANATNGHRAGNGVSLSDNESDDDAEEGDFTVYECPGLAPTGEMEVRNPMFEDDSATPKVDSKK